jgi:hypothetical protein
VRLLDYATDNGGVCWPRSIASAAEGRTFLGPTRVLREAGLRSHPGLLHLLINRTLPKILAS